MRNRRVLAAVLAAIGVVFASSTLKAEEEGKMRRSWVVQNVCTYCGPLDGGARCECEPALPEG